MSAEALMSIFAALFLWAFGFYTGLVWMRDSARVIIRTKPRRDYQLEVWTRPLGWRDFENNSDLLRHVENEVRRTT